MEELKDEITKLTNEWYHLIASDHHKDKDCHWTIKTIWSYGYPAQYKIEHYGYILNYIEEIFPSYEAALKTLKKILTESIEQEKKQKQINNDSNIFS